MITFKEKYEDTGSIFPRHDISPEKKNTPEWMRKYCEGMYASWLHGATKISHDDVERIINNRKFMRAEQDSEAYKKSFLGTVENSEIEFIRQGLMNIDWTVPAIAPKYVNIIKNMFHDTNYEVLINAIDEKSTKEKGAKKWRQWVMAEQKEALEQFNEQMGMDFFQIPDTLPETMEELQFQESIGAFKLAKELSFEAAVVEVMQRCKIPEVNKKVIEDFFAYGKGCIRDYVDPTTQKVVAEYIDIARLIISYGNADYYQPKYAGVIKTYSIATLMEKACLTEDQARNIAETYYGAGGYNKGWDYYDREDDGVYRWSEIDVQVMEAEFESIDVKYKEKVTNKYGNENIYNLSHEKARKSKNKDKVEKSDIRVRYRASYIIGTDHVFDYGYQYDVPRPTPAQAGSSFHFYDVGKPFIEILKPHINQACLAWYRIQNTITNAAETGLIIDYDSFDNMVMSNKKVKPAELIKLGKLSGTWISKRKGFTGMVNNQPIQDPVRFFEGGAGRQLEENINLYRWNIQAIEEQLGMPPIASAGRQERETTLGEQQIMFASSTNAIKHFATGLKDLLQGSCTNIVLRIQIIAKHNAKGYKAIVNSIGDERAKVLKMGPADAACEMGVEIMPVFGAQQKESIYMAAMEMLKISQAGGGGINLSDFVKIKRMLEAGLIRNAEQWLVYAEKKKAEHMKEMQEENMRLNGENQANHDQAQTQKDLALQDSKNQGALATQDKKNEGDAVKEAVKTATAPQGGSPR